MSLTLKLLLTIAALPHFFHDNDKWKKNFERVFNRCCESKRYATVQYFYSTYKDEKTADFWIERFERFVDVLESKDQVNCLLELAVLYGKQYLSTRMKSVCLSKNVGFDTIKKMYETAMQKSLFSSQVWLEIFQSIENKVGENDKDDYYKICESLCSRLGRKKTADEYRQKRKKSESASSSVSNGGGLKKSDLVDKCQQDSNKKKVPASNSAPNGGELSESKLVNKSQQVSSEKREPVSISVRDGIDIENSLHPEFSRMLNKDIKEYNIHCLSNLWSHLKEEKDFYSVQMREYINIIIKCANEKGKISKVELSDCFEKKGMSPLSERYGLHTFLYGLCREYDFGTGETAYKENYELSRYRLRNQGPCKVLSSLGYCPFPEKLTEKSFIQIALFAMETYGDTYEIIKQ